MALFVFPRCTFVDQRLIRITVKYFYPDGKWHTSVGRISLFETQKTIDSGITTTKNNLQLTLCLPPEVDSVAQHRIGAEPQPLFERPGQEGIEVIFGQQ